MASKKDVKLRSTVARARRLIIKERIDDVSVKAGGVPAGVGEDSHHKQEICGGGVQEERSEANKTTRHCTKPKLPRFVKLHFCQICQYNNQSRSDVEIHMNSHIEEEQVVCKFCKLACKHSGELKNHMTTHIGGRPFACECGASFLVFRDLITHEATHDDWGKPYSCEKCTYKSSHASFLEEHYKIVHDRLKCAFCDSRFKSVEILEKHKLLHTGEKPRRNNDVTIQDEVVTVEDDEVVEISEDEYVLDEVDEVIWINKNDGTGISVNPSRPKNTVSEESKNTNSATFAYLEQLNNSHDNTTPVRQHLCSYRPHECHRVKLHFCHICQYSSKSRCNVVAHMKIHIGKEMVCEFCKQTCDEVDSLKDHLNKHIGHRPFACEVCEESFLLPRDLMKHEISHDVEKPYFCDFCSFRCGRASFLEEHDKIVHRRFACNFCDFRSISVQDLAKHKLLHTAGKPRSEKLANVTVEEAFVSEEVDEVICISEDKNGGVFEESLSVEDEGAKTSEVSSSREDGNAPAYAVYPSREDGDAGAYAVSSSREDCNAGAYSISPSRVDDKASAYAVSVSSEDEGAGTCEVSEDDDAGASAFSPSRPKKKKLEDSKTTNDAVFDPLGDLDNASDEMTTSDQQQLCFYRSLDCHRVKLHFCHVCQYHNKSRSDVVAHMMIHIGKENVCKFCRRICKKPGGLNVHMNRHIGHRPFACDICDEGFYVLRDLMKHETSHDVEKPYSCQICSYKCRRASFLEEHNKSHLRLPYSCGLCPFRCTKASALEEHTLMHTGEKPYICDQCEFRSSRVRELKAHMAVHSGEKPFHCNVCEFRSARKGAVTQHMRIHTGETFACNFCQRTFTRRGARNAHELKAHSTKP